MTTLPVSRRTLTHPFNDLFSNMGDIFSPRLSRERSCSFDLEARDEGGNIVVRADVPGIPKEDINITLEDGMLTISATREDTRKDTDGNTYVQERSYGSFSRSLRLPPDVGENIHATLKDGVLQLVLERNEGAKPRKIEIS